MGENITSYGRALQANVPTKADVPKQTYQRHQADVTEVPDQTRTLCRFLLVLLF